MSSPNDTAHRFAEMKRDTTCRHLCYLGVCVSRLLSRSCMHLVKNNNNCKDESMKRETGQYTKKQHLIKTRKRTPKNNLKKQNKRTKNKGRLNAVMDQWSFNLIRCCRMLPELGFETSLLLSLYLVYFIEEKVFRAAATRIVFQHFVSCQIRHS